MFLRNSCNAFYTSLKLLFIFICRDEIVSKTKYLEAEAKRTADLEDTDELQIQEETEGEYTPEDDVFYDSEDNDLEEYGLLQVLLLFLIFIFV